MKSKQHHRSPTLLIAKKIETLSNVYRIRIGDKRAFFVLHISFDGDTARFEYLFSRGEAYDKKIWLSSATEILSNDTPAIIGYYWLHFCQFDCMMHKFTLKNE